jgi:hypothetical protein
MRGKFLSLSVLLQCYSGFPMWDTVIGFFWVFTGLEQWFSDKRTNVFKRIG